MGFILIIIIMIPLVPIWFLARNFHNVYFILDAIVVGFFFIYGTINLWDLKSSDVTGYWLPYIYIRLLVILVYAGVHAGIMKAMKKKSVPSRPIEENKVAIVNIAVNIIQAFAFFRYWINHIN